MGLLDEVELPTRITAIEWDLTFLRAVSSSEVLRLT